MSRELLQLAERLQDKIPVVDLIKLVSMGTNLIMDHETPIEFAEQPTTQTH